MRHYLKSLLITAATFYITKLSVPTINIGQDPKNYAIVLAGLWLLSQVVNPIFTLVLLPVNIITFGLVSFLLNLAFVFSLMNFLPQFKITAYTFPGTQIDGVILPRVELNQIETVILVAVIVTILQKILHLIFE